MKPRSHTATGRPKGRPPKSASPTELARRAVHRALREGALTKCPCEVCGLEDPVEAHHADYSKPLDVNWLCVQHHAERHGKVFSPEGLAAMAVRGPGRPRKEVDLSAFADVDKPPADHLARAGWAQDIVARNLWLIVHGKADPETSSAINAAARTIIALVPQTTLYRAEDAVRRDGAQLDDRGQGADESKTAGDGDSVFGRPPRVQ